MLACTACKPNPMLHRASACCTIRRLQKPTFCRERFRPQSSSSSSRRKAVTVISTNFLPSRPAYEICARCRQKRKKQLREIEKRASRVSGSVAGNGILTRHVEVGFVEKIERFLAFGEQLLVAVAATARALDQSFHSGCFGDRRAARVEIVHERSDSRQCLVVVQAESRKQLLKSYLVLAVEKGRAFESEPDRGRRALLSLFHPHQARLRVDETPDEPGGGEPIGQEGFAGRPKALEVIAPRLGQAAGLGRVGE